MESIEAMHTDLGNGRSVGGGSEENGVSHEARAELSREEGIKGLL